MFLEKNYLLIIILYVLMMCVRVHVHACHCSCVGVRGQVYEVGYPFNLYTYLYRGPGLD